MPGSNLDPRDVRIDPLLSGYSVAYKNESYIAPVVAPIMTSKFDGGQYPVYNQPDWFRNEARMRAPGTRAKRGTYGMTFDSFFCREVAFDREVPDELKENQMAPIDAMKDGTEFATDKVLLAKEVRVAAKMTTIANWGGGVTLAGQDQFSDYQNSDPVSVIAAAKQAIHSKTGRKVNKAVFSWPVWEKIQYHPDILDRIKYTQLGVVTIDLMQTLFGIPQILLAEALFTETPEGTAEASVAYDYVWGRHIWLGYVETNPGPMKPTAMIQFVSGPRSVKSWREEAEEQDVVRAAEKCDEKISSKILGYVIRDAVAA